MCAFGLNGCSSIVQFTNLKASKSFTDVWSKTKEGWKAVATLVTDISR